MKVTKIKGAMCPLCSEFIPEEDIPEVETHYQCGECETVYADRDTAKDCCKEWG